MPVYKGRPWPEVVVTKMGNLWAVVNHPPDDISTSIIATVGSAAEAIELALNLAIAIGGAAGFAAGSLKTKDPWIVYRPDNDVCPGGRTPMEPGRHRLVEWPPGSLKFIVEEVH
jgi:hypothetical protein